MILSMIILLINFQPYKVSVAYYTTLDASFLILLCLIYRVFRWYQYHSFKTTKLSYLIVYFDCSLFSCDNMLHDLYCTALEVFKKKMEQRVFDKGESPC